PRSGRRQLHADLGRQHPHDVLPAELSPRPAGRRRGRRPRSPARGRTGAGRRRTDAGMVRPRRALAGVASAVMVVAAALGSSARATAPMPAPFGAPVVVSDLDTGEPGVDVAPDGMIYINAPAGLFGPSHLWRSSDGVR